MMGKNEKTMRMRKRREEEEAPEDGAARLAIICTFKLVELDCKACVFTLTFKNNL